ncbi:penicillin-binding protein [Clostridium sp. P21]|uniref:Penicillin-binding protein n=1 Tax=Clostridium muellerianum TaxID=2716538 RepID=A0A7Y0EJD7_9CLOT|nr:penicillin-binding transpeptidase domain-containing protein [Clostridium muellerianum]NMM64535.1 penicillin-binding protein [Clostridium muellerianum]
MVGKKEKKFTRYTVLIVIMVIVFTAISSKLVILQILDGETYAEKANNKSIREIPEAAPRGNILDKNGSVLASSNIAYILVYNQTDESDKHFFDTMSKVFDLLDKNGETQKDDFELKINPFSFQFRGDDEETKRALEIKFKTDRGFADEIKNKLYKGKKGELTKAEKAKVDEELLKITPEETFKKLVKQYKIDDKKYTIDQQRRFMIIKDTLKMNSFSGYKPAVVANNIKKDTAFKFYQLLNDFPGIDVTTQPMRSYPNGEVASSVLGYISKIGAGDDKYAEKGYDTSTDYVGQSGIEAAFEDRLKGSKGGEIVKLNKQGRILERLGKRDPYPGQTVQLTIDKDVQAATEKALDDRMNYLRANPSEQLGSYTANATRGAAVAIDVNTGAVIALASRPGFDPNAFAAPGGLSSDLYNKYYPDVTEEGKEYIERMGISGESEEDTLNKLFPVDRSVKGKTVRQDAKDILPKPLFNYATQSRSMPGSTFKMMTAIAGLESGVITPDFGVDDEMYFDKGGGLSGRVYFRNDGPNGWVDLAKAIEKSSNPYFMTVGKMLRNQYGDDILAKYAWKFGLGADPTSDSKKSTGIEIPEAFGQVYNLWSLKNSYSQTYLWTTMEKLKAGSDDRGNKFTPIDLYDRDSDSSKIKSIKGDIKKQIQSSIKDGEKAFNKDTYKSLISSLIQTDPQYKDKNISEKEIKSMISAIYYVTVSDANSQIRAGFSMYDASIGQGIDAFTPVQIANYIATIANGGTRYSVHLVDKFLDANGKLIEQVKPEVAEKTGVKPETLEAVKAGMNAVNEKGTAAQAFQGFTIPTAGKTGTATIANDQGDFGRTDTAVYVGFAPSDKPQIAVCVMLYDGGHGSGAAYVARSMYESYFKINTNTKSNTNSDSNNTAASDNN